MSTILVTGGAGFIGSHLVDALIAQGNKVYVLDKEEVASARRNAQAEYKKGDIRDEAWEAWAEEKKPEVIFHLAACIDDRAADALMVYDHNVTGSLRVFEVAKRVGARKIVFASSCAVYGTQKTLPIAEKAMVAPQTPYGLSKLLGEQTLSFYQTPEREVVALRFGNVYGPRQEGSKESGAIAIFTEKLLKDEPYFLNGDGEATRDYVFVADVVEALCAAMRPGVLGVFNIGTGKETSTKHLLRMVKEESKGKREPIVRTEVQDAVRNMRLQIRKAKKELVWKPKVSLKKGIAKTIAWYKKEKTYATP